MIQFKFTMKKAWMMLVLLCVPLLAGAQSINVSPEQLQMLNGMSPQQLQSLSSGGSNSASSVSQESVMMAQQSALPQAVQVDNKPSVIELLIENRVGSFNTDGQGMLRQFGYSLFQGMPSTFFPAADIPIPPEYLLGPGDELNVQFYGSKDDRLSLVVDREGLVEIPNAGSLSLAGMSFMDAKATIAEQVRQKMIGVTVSVAMGRLRSIRVFVLGDVNYPGSYLVSGLSTMSHALYAAGGISKKGSLRSIQLKRLGKSVQELDLYDFLLSGDNTADQRLQPGDVVFVPPIGEVVSVAGQVTRPAIYELKREKTVQDVVSLAGNTLPGADIAHMQLDRITKYGERKLLDFNLSTEAKKVGIHNGDMIMLYPVSTESKSSVAVLGEVMRPGQYGIKAAMRLADLIRLAGGPTERAYLKEGEVTRYRVVEGNRRVSEHFNVDVQAALSGNKEGDVQLQANDVVTIRTIGNWRAYEKITLSGEVKFPGAYTIEEGEKLTDVLKRAGGFTDSAYLKGAVFTREDIRQEQQKQMDDMASRMEVEIVQMESVITTINDMELRKHNEASLGAAKRVLEQMKQTKALGRLVIRLKDIKTMERDDFNLTLTDGDKLFVPQQSDQVTVIGQVYNSTALLYRKGLNASDYVDAAGGPTRFADEGRMYVVRADGYVQRISGWGGTPVYPGDAIVVPEDLEQFNLLDTTLDWSRVLMQVGVGIASMKTIGVL